MFVSHIQCGGAPAQGMPCSLAQLPSVACPFSAFECVFLFVQAWPQLVVCAPVLHRPLAYIPCMNCIQPYACMCFLAVFVIPG